MFNLFSNNNTSDSRRFTRRTVLGLVAGLTALSAMAAFSVNIPFDSAAFLPGTTVAATPKLAGPIIVDTMRPFTVMNSTGTVVCKGQLQDRVVRETSTCLLDFYFRVIVNEGSKMGVTSVTRFNYPHTALLDANFRTDGVGVDAPDSVYRAGNGLTFQFMRTPVQPNADSRFTFISTQSKNMWAGGTTVVQTPDGSGAVLTTYAPQ